MCDLIHLSTCLSYSEPLASHFYVVEQRLTGGDTIFVVFAPKQDFVYPLEPSLIAVFTSTHNLSLEQNEKNVATLYI